MLRLMVSLLIFSITNCFGCAYWSYGDGKAEHVSLFKDYQNVVVVGKDGYVMVGDSAVNSESLKMIAEGLAKGLKP